MPSTGPSSRVPTPSTGHRGRRLSLLIAVLVLLSDQLSKAWATRVLAGRADQTLLPGLLNLTYTTNTGAAFSLFKGSSHVLGLVSLVASVAVAVWIIREGRRPMPWSRSLALGCLLGGALGNGLDRWRLGEVVDFLALVPVSFPVFNLADVAINLAVLAFAVDLISSPSQKEG